jgi:SAM-dependent methyltransferase
MLFVAMIPKKVAGLLFFVLSGSTTSLVRRFGGSRVVIRNIGQSIVHLMTGTRKFYYRQLEKIAASTSKARVLEIGSGKPTRKNQYDYSARHLFTEAGEFVQTDINPDFGHRVLDIVTMSDEEDWDVILCLNVLEHVFELEAAVTNLYRALRPGGRLCVAVPFTFPLHDEPRDYWRLTEHTLRRLFNDFESIDLRRKGPRLLPLGYFLVATRADSKS